MAAILSLPVAGIAADASKPGAVSLLVRETAGIRRGNFPAEARVELPRGSLKDLANLRLLLGDKEVPVQAVAESRWPDGSIRQVDLNFNSSIGPLAELRYRLEIGGSVRAAPIVTERLDIVESTDGLQVGKVRFGKHPARLLQSVAFGREILGSGLNAFTVTDAEGEIHPLAGLVSIAVEKSGPLYVRIRYSGTLQLGANYSVPYAITLEVPNSKSWVKYIATVEDPAQRIRSIAFNTSLAFAEFPWTWDFGTGSWSYGAFRNATDSAVLVQRVGEAGVSDWQISTGRKGEELPYERSGGQRPGRAEGWGHLQDSQRAVAFAFDQFGAESGAYHIEIDGSGQLAFRFLPTRSRPSLRLAVYQHYVASPAAIGAATNPVSMSSPLAISVDAGNQP